MNGIFIRGGVCNEAMHQPSVSSTGKVSSHRRNERREPGVPGRLCCIFVSHTVISGSGRMRGGRRNATSTTCLAAATWLGALKRTFRLLFDNPLSVYSP